MPKRPYDSRLWRQLRLEVLERDDYRCRLRMVGCDEVANEVHHLTSWTDGGNAFDKTNLIAACKPCNVREANARRKAKEEGRQYRRPAPGPSSLFTGQGTAHLPPAPPPSRDW